MMLHPATHVSVSIARPPQIVYDFVAEGSNLPLWAGSLCREARPGHEGEWILETAQGPARLVFAPRNPFGVLDHEVIVPGSAAVHVPLRVVANGDGAEVVLTLFRTEAMSDESHRADLLAVRRDLQALKGLLER
jgi:hypothetical protein